MLHFLTIKTYVLALRNSKDQDIYKSAKMKSIYSTV